jgi:hypothetical protein
MRDRDEQRSRLEILHLGDNPDERHMKYRGRCGDENTGDSDCLTERAINRTTIVRGFPVRGDVGGIGNGRNATGILRSNVDMGLGDERLEDKGQRSHEHDGARHETRARQARISRGSRHESPQSIPAAYATAAEIRQLNLA